MVVAILSESGVKVSEETLETIVDKAKIIHIMDQNLSFSLFFQIQTKHLLDILMLNVVSRRHLQMRISIMTVR